MIDIMLDLETWGTAPGCDIRSIGATLFIPHTGAVCTPNHIQKDAGYPQGTFYIATDNPTQHHWEPVRPKYPLTRDARTVQWWSEQSDDAQAAFADPVDLREALRAFMQWIDNLTWANNDDTPSHVENRTTLRIWSHGASFDPPILAAAYAAVGLPVPWHYRAPRDTRTIFDAAGIEDHSAWLDQHPGPLGISHHALDDAICQARAVCAAMERLRG